MPERITVQFQSPDGERSCVLYARRGHPELLEAALAFARRLTAEVDRNPNPAIQFPVQRYEVDTVVLEFLRHLSEEPWGPHVDRLLAPGRWGISEGNHHIIRLPERGEPTLVQESDPKGMSVADVIGKLYQHPPDTRVVMSGYEGGYDDLRPEQITLIRAALNANDSWVYGDHDATGDPGDTECLAFTRWPDADALSARPATEKGDNS